MNYKYMVLTYPDRVFLDRILKDTDNIELVPILKTIREKQGYYFCFSHYEEQLIKQELLNKQSSLSPLERRASTYLINKID